MFTFLYMTNLMSFAKIKPSLHLLSNLASVVVRVQAAQVMSKL